MTHPSPHAGLLDRLGSVLLVVSTLFTAVLCAPEIPLGAVSVHDGTFHTALAQRLLDAWGSGESVLDPWVSFSSLGAPVWRTYQPLVHQLLAVAIALGGPLVGPGVVAGAFTWLALTLHPAAFYVGGRWLGLDRFGAGVAALVCLAPVALGNLDVFSVGYASYAWRGSGLVTQLVGLPLGVLALGATAAALRGDGSRTRAALLIALTALSHLIVGYAAAVSAVLLALVARPRPARFARVLVVGGGVFALCAWLVVPALLEGDAVNRSVWEPAWKWTSHGAPVLVRTLLQGELFDAGRLPVLSALLGLGAVLAIARWDAPRSRAILGLAGLWLLLSFGRATLGGLLPSWLVHDGIHLHRLVAVFQACAVLLIGLGADLATRHRAGLAVGLVLVASTIPALRERADWLRENARMGAAHQVAIDAQEADLDEVMALADGEGRWFAGLAGRWGRQFLVGHGPAYHALGARGVDATSHLWHSMSIPSDALLLIDDRSVDHLRRFGIRHVLAEPSRPMPPELEFVGARGRFGLWAVPGGSYFGVVRDPPPTPPGDAMARYHRARAWLASEVPSAGRVVTESRDGADHDALVALDAPATVVFRSTWHPAWRVTVDGRDVPSRSVVPGFLAVDVPAGEHDVRVRWRPGPGKAALLLLGLLAFAAFVRGERRGTLDTLEARLEAALDRLALATRTLTPRPALAATLLLGLLASAPYVRSTLLLGHDALEYPTRLAELHEVLRQGVLLPVWAPDLGAGFGQPMFGFVPPLLLYVAEVPHLLGLELAGSLNAAVVVLTLVGALGMAALGQRVGGLTGALIASAAFLFGGYLQLELFVRAAWMEYSGLAVLPLAVHLVLRCLERPGPAPVVAASFAVAAVALSHNAILLIGGPALALLVFVVAGARRDLGGLLRGAAAGVGGLGLSAWFWLPALAEKEYTHAHRLLENDATRWEGHFVHRSQLWDSDWGFGLSVPGPADALSFEVGVPLLVLAGLGVAAALTDRRAVPRALAAVAVLVSAAALFMTHFASWGVWARLELVQYLQFPWRFLALPAVFLPVLAAATGRWLGPRTGAVAVAALVAGGLVHLGPHGEQALADDAFTPERIARDGLETTTFREFEPIWVTERPAYRHERLRVVDGRARIRTVARRATRQEFLVDADEASRLELGTLHFPGWEVRVDGAPVAVSFADSQGLPRFDVPAGRSTVEAVFRLTPVRRASRWLGVLTLLVLAGSLGMSTSSHRDPDDGGRRPWELGIAIGLGALLLGAVLLSDEPAPGERSAEEEASAVWLQLGIEALEQGRLEDAADAFEEAADADDRSFAAWQDLGIARSRLDQHRGALQAFTRALELDPSSVDARFNVGLTWWHLGDPARSIEYLVPASQADPRRPEVWYQLGLARAALGEREAAMAAFSRTRQLDPRAAHATKALMELQAQGEDAGSESTPGAE